MAYLLAFGRWGSHLHIPGTPVYVTEIMLAGSCVIWWRAGGRWPAIRRALPQLGFVLALGVLALARLGLGGEYSVTAMRDAMPYLYVLVVLAPLAPHAPEAASRTFAVLRAALLIRLALVIVALVFPDFVLGLPTVGPPGPGATVLALRADLDASLLVVLAMTSAMRLTSKRGRRGRVATEAVVLLASAGTALYLGSRAGLVAMVVTAAIVGTTAVWPRRHAVARPVRYAVAVVAIALVAVVAPQTAAVRRLADARQALGIDLDTSKPEAHATGTARARLESWRKTVRYTNADASRRAIGVGFGPDFLHDSGGDVILEGQAYTGVRAPHNYVLNTFARMGWAGVVVLLLALLSILRAVMRVMSSDPDDIDVLTSLLFVALLVVSLFGVVMESPFGAVPAFWSAGWVLTRRVTQRGSGVLRSPRDVPRIRLSGRTSA